MILFQLRYRRSTIQAQSIMFSLMQRRIWRSLTTKTSLFTTRWCLWAQLEKVSLPFTPCIHLVRITFRPEFWQKYIAVLDDSGKTAFQNFLNKGGNFIAVHSASDTLRTTQFYMEEVGEPLSLNLVPDSLTAHMHGRCLFWLPSCFTERCKLLNFPRNFAQSDLRSKDGRCHWAPTP